MIYTHPQPVTTVDLDHSNEAHARLERFAEQQVKSKNTAYALRFPSGLYYVRQDVAGTKEQAAKFSVDEVFKFRRNGFGLQACVVVNLIKD